MAFFKAVVSGLVCISLSFSVGLPPAGAVEFRTGVPFSTISPDGLTFILPGFEVLRLYDPATNLITPVDIGSPAGHFVGALAITNGGAFAVGSVSPTSGPTAPLAYRWSSATGFQLLGTIPGVTLTQAEDVSADGSVVVGLGITDDGDEGGAFRWTEATGMVDLGVLPGFNQPKSFAVAVSGDGQTTVGGVMDFDSRELSGMAFRWTPSEGMVALGDLPGGESHSQADMISTDGSTIAGFSQSAGGREPFRWTASEGIVGLGFLHPDHNSAIPTAISGDGSTIIGFSEGPNFGRDSFIWDAQHGMRSLSDYFESLGADLGGLQFMQVFAMSDDARVFMGTGAANGQTVNWLFIVPEPSTLAMLLAALPLGYLAYRRRCPEPPTC